MGSGGNARTAQNVRMLMVLVPCLTLPLAGSLGSHVPAMSGAATAALHFSVTRSHC